MESKQESRPLACHRIGKKAARGRWYGRQAQKCGGGSVQGIADCDIAHAGCDARARFRFRDPRAQSGDQAGGDSVRRARGGSARRRSRICDRRGGRDGVYDSGLRYVCAAGRRRVFDRGHAGRNPDRRGGRRRTSPPKCAEPKRREKGPLLFWRGPQFIDNWGRTLSARCRCRFPGCRAACTGARRPDSGRGRPSAAPAPNTARGRRACRGRFWAAS